MSTETLNPETPAQDNPDAASQEELDAGLVLNDGETFKTPRSAAQKMKELGLPAKSWEVNDYGDGFAIMKRTRQDDSKPGPKEQFKWVRFHKKSNPMDPEEVTLGVNGEVLIIMRGQRIPLPQRFLEVADHAVFKTYSIDPGKERKVSGEIHKYPYDILGDATPDDFFRWKRAGTKATRDHADKIGLSIEG